MPGLYHDILRREMAPALGCTEPAAAALAVARACEALGEPAATIELQVSRNILKNAMGVGIPGTGMAGLAIAAALAAEAGRADYGLEVLRDAAEADIRRASARAEAGLVTVSLAENSKLLYIKATCRGARHVAEVEIEDLHTNITSVTLDGAPLYQGGAGGDPAGPAAAGYAITLAGIYGYATTAPIEELEFLQQAIEMNARVAEAGLDGSCGSGIGRSLSGTGEVAAYAAAYAAAASDARMAGCTLPVMSAAGSGNQGITATLPVAVAARRWNSGRENTLRAVALSVLVTVHIRQHIGKLSALCGCAIAAATGTAGALTFLQGGNFSAFEYAIINMVADISGMICDGAKAGCALKIATAVGGAFQCARLALDGVVIGAQDGIVCDCAEKTIGNLGRLAVDGMTATDRVILDMMVCK